MVPPGGQTVAKKFDLWSTQKYSQVSKTCLAGAETFFRVSYMFKPTVPRNLRNIFGYEKVRNTYMSSFCFCFGISLIKQNTRNYHQKCNSHFDVTIYHCFRRHFDNFSTLRQVLNRQVVTFESLLMMCTVRFFT